MKSFKKVVIEKNQIDTITCNMCGENIDKNEFGYFDEYISIEKNWGYGSEFDGENHSLDICQLCYKKIYENLKIKP